MLGGLETSQNLLQSYRGVALSANNNACPHPHSRWFRDHHGMEIVSGKAVTPSSLNSLELTYVPGRNCSSFLQQLRVVSPRLQVFTTTTAQFSTSNGVSFVQLQKTNSSPARQVIQPFTFVPTDKIEVIRSSTVQCFLMYREKKQFTIRNTYCFYVPLLAYSSSRQFNQQSEFFSYICLKLFFSPPRYVTPGTSQNVFLHSPMQVFSSTTVRITLHAR